MKKISLRDKLPSMFVDNFSFTRFGDLYIDDGWRPEGVTSQFIDEADTYHDRYFDRLDFITLTERCLKCSGVNFENNISVLDIGSGGGSSVFAAAKLLANAEIVASDISPQLLTKITTFVEKQDDLKTRIAAVCFDLHNQVFKNSQFDIILGMAILHHLVSPLDALKNVVKSLKDEGKIILVEPLEGGHLALLTLYDQILCTLKLLKSEDSRLSSLIKALRLDYQARMGVPNIQAWTPHLDDKWVFGEAYLQDLCRELDLTSIQIYPAQPRTEFLFEESFRSLLSDSGNSNLQIPNEILQLIKDFDLGISNNLKKKLCPTGIVVMKK
jgi:SAM-dependent methyltransferase